MFKIEKLHPAVLFFLGFVFGAIVLGLFFSRFLQPDDYKSSLLRTNSTLDTSSVQSTETIIVPTSTLQGTVDSTSTTTTTSRTLDTRNAGDPIPF